MFMDFYIWPQPKPIRNGKYTYTHNGINVVRVETDEGISGLGLGTLGTGRTMFFRHSCPLLYPRLKKDYFEFKMGL